MLTRDTSYPQVHLYPHSASPFLSQTFETDYPRLVVLFVRLLDRLEQQRRGGRAADPADEQQRKER